MEHSTNGKKLIKAIRKAGRKFPNRIIAGGRCEYLTINEEIYDHVEVCPSCIVGWGLVEAGFINPQNYCADPETPLPEWNGKQFIAACYSIPGLENLTAEELEWISKVQKWQDGQIPWALAVAFTDMDQLDIEDQVDAKRIEKQLVDMGIYNAG